MTVQNQDWTAYFSKTGRTLTVDYIRPADPGLTREWHTAYEIPASNNYTFEITDISDLRYSQLLNDEFVFTSGTYWSARILRSTGVVTPISIWLRRGHEWRRTGFIMQPGDQLQITSDWDGNSGSNQYQYHWVISGNVAR